MLGKVRQWWRDLSIFKKLYGVVGVMALLIALELFSMLFTMGVLSAVRSFVGGEGMWSKAQKDAVHSLHKYVFTGNSKHYQEFHEHLKVNLGDRQARLELILKDPNFEKARQGFVQGKIHPNDIDGIIKLFRRFYWVSYIAEAIEIWTAADDSLGDLIKAGEEVHKAMIQVPIQPQRVEGALAKVDKLNNHLTTLEDRFSYVLGEGSRWLEGVLKWLLLCAVLTVESTGLLLTITFARNLNRNIADMTHVAERVGQGDFSQKAVVNSEDELGQLAMTINKMTDDLKASIGRRREAESANHIKSLFLANMSHEIRTPLGVILGLTEVLKDRNLPEEDRIRFIEIIERTGIDLRRIVNDILDITKVEAGHLEIDKTRFSLQEFIQELELTLQPVATKNSNLIHFRELGSHRNFIYTDSVRLRQILVNVLGNALKFTRNGTVEMRYWAQGANLNFEISDSGIGLTEEQAAHLFQPFAQADASTTRRFGGTGLGLFLSKRLAAVLGGDLKLKSSEAGRGSTFLLTVDAGIYATPSLKIEQEVVAPKNDLRGHKVLIVDDSEDNQILLKFFLNKWHLDFETAQNGQEAIEKAREKDFDLILMDMQMPIMDGYEATRQLRRQHYDKPVIALTAHAMKEDRERCLKVGCVEYLTKPVDFNQLHRTLQRFLV